MESESVFKVLKKFMRGQEKKRTLLENARGVVKRDHLLGQLQAEASGSIAVHTAATQFAEAPLLPEPIAMEAPAPEEAQVSPAQEKAPRKRSRAKKPAKKPIPEQAASAFGFMTDIDLELKGVVIEAPAPPETLDLPPDFEAKLQQLSKLMNFDDC